MVQVQAAIYAGTAYLCSAVKSRGHEFVLFLNSDIKKILNKISQEKPDLIGFSCMSTVYNDVLRITKVIKKRFKTPIIIGGAHATFFPDIIKEKSIDMICRGEGELAIMELLDAIQDKRSCETIKNIWLKSGDKIIKNELRPLVDPLDDLPLIDWSCYKGSEILKNSPPTVFIIRGCPYSCTYCFNEATRNLYHGKGKYVRHFSVERSIREIEEAIKWFSNDPVVFTSDSFGTDIKWMEVLFKRYDELTDRPFVLLLRPELASDDCIRILAKHNCYSVAIGVESGSERVRRDILNRNYSNEYLIDVAKRLHKFKIKFRTYNMIGLPTETEKELWDTIDINIKMKADFPKAQIYLPLPDTKIVDIAKETGYLDHDFSFESIPPSIYQRTVLKKVDKNRIINSLYFFQTTIIFPKSIPLIKKLIKLKTNFLFKYWFSFIHVYLHRKSEKRALLPYIKFVYQNRKEI